MIKLYEDMLSEMAISGYGDWEGSKSMVSTISSIPLKLNWKYLGIIESRNKDKFEVYINSSKDVYVCGNFVTFESGDTMFEVDFEIKLNAMYILSKRFKLKNLMNVDGVKVNKDKQGQGIAIAMYKFLVNKEKLTILGDEMQYFGARRLWKRLSASEDMIVDIIDIDKDEYIERDVLLKHGSKDWEFDTRVWSYDVDKKDIRTVLKKII